MPVDEVRIDEALWAKGSAQRKKEWRALIVDLRQAELWPGRSLRSMIVRLDVSLLVLELRMPDGEMEAVEVARGEIESLLAEYISVIHRLQEEGLPMPRAEALDMAKRVVHDDAARKLAAAVPGLAADHELRRRFFSLVVSMATDTSGVSVAHRHH